MRLSLQKAAHVALDGVAYRKSGYLTTFFVGRCGKFTALSPQLLEFRWRSPRYKRSRSVIFPHLPTKTKRGEIWRHPSSWQGGLPKFSSHAYTKAISGQLDAARLKGSGVSAKPASLMICDAKTLSRQEGRLLPCRFSNGRSVRVYFRLQSMPGGPFHRRERTRANVPAPPWQSADHRWHTQSLPDPCSRKCRPDRAR